MQDTKKKLQMLAAGILGIACLGVAGFILFQKFGSSPAPSLPPAAKSAQPTGKPKSPAKPRDTASMPREAAKEGVGKSPMLQQAQNSPSTLGELSRYRGQKVITIDKVKVVAPWHEADWELSGIPDLLMEPGPGPDGMGLFPMLAEIPGLTVESITFNNGWSMKGSIYARH